MNKRRLIGARSLALALILGLSPLPARAVIERPYPLEKAISESQFIFTTKVEKLDPDKPAVVLAVGDSLKGKVPFARLPINLTGDEDARKKKEAPQLLKRLAPKLPLVLFVTRLDKQYLCLAYTNGSWFQMTAPDEGENPVWSFTHVEPYLRRTFKGTTAEMQEAIAGVLSGKKPAPKHDPKEKPGLGPEVDAKDQGQRTKDKEQPANAVSSFVLRPSSFSGGGPVFAVIPTVAIGGVISLLAMLFPAVFGGLTGQLEALDEPHLGGQPQHDPPVDPRLAYAEPAGNLVGDADGAVGDDDHHHGAGGSLGLAAAPARAGG